VSIGLRLLVPPPHDEEVIVGNEVPVNDQFGGAVAMSANGKTVVVGALDPRAGGLECLNVPGCPLNANGDRPGDLTGIRVCFGDDTVPSPAFGKKTACGTAGPEGCAVCSPPATPVCH
jgi:hypothetical protein